MSKSNVNRVPKVDDKLWYGFLSCLEAKNSKSGSADRENHSILVTDTEAETTMASIAPNDAIKSISSSDNEENNIVVLSSDSENESETVWSSNCKTKGYKRLWEKARQLIFHRLISNYSCTKNYAPENDTEDSLFPYLKLQQLSEDLRNFQQDHTLNNVELAFLWENVIQWLIAIKLSSDPLDLNNEQFNLILVDFMAQYVNYKTKLYCNIASNDKSQEKASQIMQTMSVIFNGNGSHVLMTLLRIELKLEYRQILNPIFKKYLTDRSLCQTSNDFVVYLRIIFCFKRWKIITPVRSDRERINEIAVGKSMRYLRSEGSDEVQDLTTDSILPKVVPKVNVQNVAFASISDLIGFATERKAIGTRILLVYTSLDLEDAIAKYFRLYERYIRKTVCEDQNVSLCRAVSEMNTGGSQFPNITPTSSRQEAKFGTVLNLQKTQRSTQPSKLQHRSQRSGLSTATHLGTACDPHKNKLSSRFSSSIRNHNFNNLKSHSDISLSVKIDSLSHTVSSIDIDSTDDESENLHTRATNSRYQNSVDINKSIDCKTHNQKLIEQPIDRPNHTPNLRISDQNIETESFSLNTSSDDDASVGKVKTNASHNTKSPSIPKAHDEKTPETETCSPKFLNISSVATKPTRNEKNCIPGVVSSTSDFVKCNSKNVVDKIPESLEVHSAGTYTNAREVGTVKVVEQPLSPCQPVIVSGNYNPGSLVLGIDYSDVSSDNEDEDAQNSFNMLSCGYWKVVEEATSSTSAAEVLSASELTSLPVQSSKSSPDQFSDDMPTCSRYANKAALRVPSNELNKDEQMESSIAVDEPENVTDKSQVDATIQNNLESEKCNADEKSNQSKNLTVNTQIELSQNNLSDAYEKVGFDSSENPIKQTVDVLNVSTDEPVKRNFGDLKKHDVILNQESTICETQNTKTVSQETSGVCLQGPDSGQVAEKSSPQVEVDRVNHNSIASCSDNEESAQIEKLLRDIEDNLEKSEKNDLIVLTSTEENNETTTVPLNVEASTEPAARETAPDSIRSSEIDKSSALESEEILNYDKLGNMLESQNVSNIKKIDNVDAGDNTNISNTEITFQSDLKSSDSPDVEIVASTQQNCGNKSEAKTSVTHDFTADRSIQEIKDFSDKDDSKKSIRKTCISVSTSKKITTSDQETTPDSMDSNQLGVLECVETMAEKSNTDELNNDEQENNSDSETNTRETHNYSIGTMECEESDLLQETLPSHENVLNTEIRTITNHNDCTLPLTSGNSSNEKQDVTEVSNGITMSFNMQDNIESNRSEKGKTQRRIFTETTKVEEPTSAVEGKEKSIKCEKTYVEIAGGSKQLNVPTNFDENGTVINEIEKIMHEKPLADDGEPNQTIGSTAFEVNIEAEIKLDESLKVGVNISNSEKDLYETKGKEFSEANKESLKFKKSSKNCNYELNPIKKAKVNKNRQTACKPKNKEHQEKSSFEKVTLFQSDREVSVNEQAEKKKCELLQSTKKPKISNQPERTSVEKDLLLQSTKKTCVNVQPEEKEEKLFRSTKKSKIFDKPEERSSIDKDPFVQSTKKTCINEKLEEKKDKLLQSTEKPNISLQPEETTSNDKNSLLESNKKACVDELSKENKGKFQSPKKSKISDQPERTSVAKDQFVQPTKKTCINEKLEEKKDKLSQSTEKPSVYVQPEEQTSNDNDPLLVLTKKDCFNERAEEKEDTQKGFQSERTSIDKDLLPKKDESFECNAVSLKEPENKVFSATKKIFSISEHNQECKLDEGSINKEPTSSDKMNHAMNEKLSLEDEKSCQQRKNLATESIFPNVSGVSKELKEFIVADIQIKSNICVEEPTSIKRKRGKKKLSKLNLSTPLTGAEDDENELVNLVSNASLKEIELSVGNEIELLENYERTPPKNLSEADVEKRTPWKMRIKRRLSQCSDINKEFNIDINENSGNDFTSSIYVPTDNCTSVGVKPLRSTAINIDADELALNFSKLDIKRNQTEVENKSNTNHLISSSCNKSNFEGRRKKQKIVKHVQESLKPITDQVNGLDQMPSDYNQEEILAVEALINMQVSSSNDSPESIEVGESSEAKPECSLNDTEVMPETKPILKSMLKGKHPKSGIKKQVRYAEEIHLKRLTSEKAMINSTKFCNKLKAIRSSNGALLKNGDKTMRKRLSEINARFNLELASDTADSLDSMPSSSNSEVGQIFKNFTEVSKEKQSFKSAIETIQTLTEEILLEKEAENCVRETIEINESFKVVDTQTIKRRRGRRKNMIRSTTNSEVLENPVCEPNLPIYPVLLTARRQTLNSEHVQFDKADIVKFSDEPLMASTKVEESFNKAEVNVRNVNVEGANIRIKIKMPEPERHDKFKVPLKTVDEVLPSNSGIDNDNDKEVQLQDKTQQMQLKKVIIRLKRIKLLQKNPIAIGTTIAGVSKNISPCKASIFKEGEEGIEMRTSLSTNNTKCKNLKPESKPLKHELVEKNPTANVTNKSELKPRNHCELVNKSIDCLKTEPKKRKMRNEFILKPCDVILTEEIINIRAKEITNEHNSKHTSNLSETLVHFNTNSEPAKLKEKPKKPNSANEAKKAKVNKMLQTIFKPKIVEQLETSSFEKDQLPQSAKNASISEQLEKNASAEKDTHLESKNKKEKVNEQSENKSSDEKDKLNKLTKKVKIIDQSENTYMDKDQFLKSKKKTNIGEKLQKKPSLGKGKHPSPSIEKDKLPQSTKKTEITEKLQKKLSDKHLQSPNKMENISKRNKKFSDEKDELIQATKKATIGEYAEKKSCDEMEKLQLSTKKIKTTIQSEKPSNDKDELIQSTKRTHIIEKLEKKPTVENDKHSNSSKKKVSANEQPEKKPCDEMDKLQQSMKTPKNVEKKKLLQSKTDSENADKSKLEKEQFTTMKKIKNLEVEESKLDTILKSQTNNNDGTNMKGSPTDRTVENNSNILSIEVKERSDVLHADLHSQKFDDIDSDDTANQITEGVIAELKLLSPENMLMQDSPVELSENDHVDKELNKNTTMTCEQKRLQAAVNQSNEQKIIDDEQNNAKLLDSAIEFSIDAILGKQNDKVADKSKPVDQTISPTKARLGILTAEKINSSIERSLEQKRSMLCSETSRPSENFSPKVSGESISCYKFATKNVLKSSLNDVKINSNVPEVLLAGDDSENSNSGEAVTGEEFILSLDDLLTKKDESIAQNDCEILPNKVKTDKRQSPGTPNFAVELEIETSQASENSQPSVSGVSSRTASIDSNDTQELNLESQPSFSLASYDNPIDFNMTNGIPDFNDDVLDRMLFEQSIDCMISVEDYKQKCSQDNFASSKGGTNSQTEKSKEHNTSATTSEVCLPKILESKETTQTSANGSTVAIGQANYLGAINTIDEVEASTTIEFDLNVTMEDLLGSNGDDLFAFSELEKSQSRINPFSNDSESGSPPLNETSESIASNTDSVAFDHSYNKDIKNLPKKKESIGKTIRPKRLPPSLVRTQSSPPKIESYNSPNKLKSHPAPYWKFKRNYEIKTSTPQSKKPISCNETFQNTICEPKHVDSSNALDTVAPKVTCRDKLLCNMPDIEMGATDSCRPFGLSIQSSTSKPTNRSNCIQPAMIYRTNTKAAQKNTAEITEIVTIPPPAAAEITNVTDEDAHSSTVLDGSEKNLEVSTQKIASTASLCPSTASENTHIVIHTPPIITQAIIRLQSQTNRLERIDSVSELNFNYVGEQLSIQSTNESNTNYSTLPRGSTPTLDEHSKEGDDFSSENVTFSEPQRESIVEPKRSTKRESSTQLDIPPAKRAFVADSSELSSTNDISGMIKRDQSMKNVPTKSEKQPSPNDTLSESPKKEKKSPRFHANHEKKPSAIIDKPICPQNTDSIIQDSKKGIPSNSNESPQQTLPSLPIFSNTVEPTETINIITDAKNLPEKNTIICVNQTNTSITEINSNITKKQHQVNPTEALTHKLKRSISSRSSTSEVDSVRSTPPISGKYRKSHITSEAIATVPGTSPAKQSTSAKILKKEMITVSEKVSDKSVPPNSGTLPRSESQPPTTLKAHTFNSTNHYNPHLQKHKYVYQRIPDKLNSNKKPEPVKPVHKLQYNASPIPAIDISTIKLTPDIEKTIETELQAYRRTLKNVTSYKQHRELMELQKKKLQLEFLEQEKRRQTLKLMTEANKRKPNSESYQQKPTIEVHKRKSNTESYQQQYRKFSMDECKPVNEKTHVYSTPLTVPTAWEPKMASKDEIIERLSKMKRS